MDRYLLNSTVSWGAIIAGGFVAAAVTLIVAAFGVGAGLAVVSPWSGEGISATTASWAAGLFLVVIAMLASTIGGYITGRLRHGWEDVHEDERFFRDTAHGFVTWACATVMTASVLAAAGTHIIAGASAGAIPAAAAGASQEKQLWGVSSRSPAAERHDNSDDRCGVFSRHGHWRYCV